MANTNGDRMDGCFISKKVLQMISNKHTSLTMEEVDNDEQYNLPY